MNNIKNIVFDFGNVLIDVDIPKAEDAFKKLLDSDYNHINQELKSNQFFERFEIGDFSEESFLWAFQKRTSKKLDPREIIDSWNQMLIGIPIQRFDFLNRLNKKYKVYLFSNTNAIHIKWVDNYLKQKFGIADFEKQFFQKIYYSFEMGMRKPDVESFKYILDDANLEATKTLFVDDNIDNIKAAQQLGIQTLHHQEGHEIVEVMKRY